MINKLANKFRFLTIRPRMGLLLILQFLPIVFLLWSLINVYETQLAFSEKERLGIRYQRSVMLLLNESIHL